MATPSIPRAMTLVVPFLASAAIHCRTVPTTPAGPEPQAPAVAALVLDAGQVARGAYVATISGCKVCHDGAGPNITPDLDTGIGTWSDTQIIAAIRRGIRPDGDKLIPLMPYPSYHQMTDADAHALVAYLRSQKPVSNLVKRENRFNLTPIAMPEPTGNVDNLDDPKEHGQYLANLMHCGACHTPTDGGQANVTFAGGVMLPRSSTDSIMSSNISSDPGTGIGSWKEDDVMRLVRTGKTPDGRKIEGPMARYVACWGSIEERDLRALATYVKSVAPAHNEVPSRQAAR